MLRAARARRGRGRGPTANRRPALEGSGRPGAAPGWEEVRKALARPELCGDTRRVHFAKINNPPTPLSFFLGLPLPAPVPCPKVSKLLCGRGHLPLGDLAASATPRGVSWNFLRGGSLLGVRSFGVRGCFAGSRDGVRGDWRGRRWQRAPSFCVRLGPAAPRVGGTAARAEDRGRRRAAPAGCGGHASPGIRGLRPGPGERAAGKGARSGGAFPVAGSVPGLRPAGGPSSYQGLTGAAGDSSSAWGAPPGNECTGATHPGLGPPPPCPRRASGTPPGLLLPFPDFLLKSV